MNISEQFPDRDTDTGNTKTLKHGYRWGVQHGAIDPETPKAKLLWKSLDGQMTYAEFVNGMDALKRADAH